MSEKERKWNNKKCTIKTQNGRKSVRRQKWNKEQEQQIENSNEYGRYESNYINHYSECQQYKMCQLKNGDYWS